MGQAVLTRRHIEPGARIFSEGDPADAAYIIEQGRVELTKRVNGRDHVVATLRAGEILGEMALLDDNVRSASARALDDVALATIDPRAFHGYMNRTPPFVRKMMIVLNERLRQQTATVAARQTEKAG